MNLSPIIPSAEELRPYLTKLETDLPGGVLLIAIHQPSSQNYPVVSFGIFSADERKAIKAAVLKIKAKREAARGGNS